MQSKSSIDIAPEDLTLLQSILKRWIPNYEVWAFGSRVAGNARKFSDLDLAVISKTHPLALIFTLALKRHLANQHYHLK